MMIAAARYATPDAATSRQADMSCAVAASACRPRAALLRPPSFRCRDAGTGRRQVRCRHFDAAAAAASVAGPAYAASFTTLRLRAMPMPPDIFRFRFLFFATLAVSS